MNSYLFIMNHIYGYIFCIHLFYFAVILLSEVPEVRLDVIYRNAVSDSFLGSVM